MNEDTINIENSWKKVLGDEFEQAHMKDLKEFLAAELHKNKTIYPPGSEIFAAFNFTPFKKVKVVIIGQDPYHGENQAHGLSFSVKRGIKIPPSLMNIYKELKNDIGCTVASHGNLEDWAKQGVLLLNSALTVEKGKAASHRNKGWEKFTDRIIQELNKKCENLVFILWGGPAQKKGSIVDSSKHLVLKAPHPSPLSSYRGFFGCKHFSQTNDYLRSKGISEIDWEIAE